MNFNLDLNKIVESSTIHNLDFNKLLSNILNAGVQIIAIIILSFICIKIVNKFCDKIFSKVMIFSEQKNKTLKRTIKAFSKGVIIFTAFSSIMSIFNINMTSVLAVAGVGSLAIGFAAQGLVKDFLVGGFILLEDQYNIGDLIEVNGILGTVEDVTMRVTKIRSFNGKLHIIPNGEITMVTSLSKEYTRAIVNIGVAYNEDIDKVLSLMKKELAGVEKNIENLLTEPEILGISEFNENNINILIFANCEPGTHYGVEREIRLIIRKAFEREHITAPIPQKIVSIKEAQSGL